MIFESIGTMSESQFTLLLIEPERENDTLPSSTACSEAAIISQGILLQGVDHEAISASSKCQ